MAARPQYTESDMLRMQQDAIARVREMQDRARQTVEVANRDADTPPLPPPADGRNYRNWSTNPNVQRQRSRFRQQNKEHPQAPSPPPITEPEPEQEIPIPPEPQAQPKESTTLIQDILNAIGIDDDRLLIIGLLFLLINAKADTTLILALIYLLI